MKCLSCECPCASLTSCPACSEREIAAGMMARADQLTHVIEAFKKTAESAQYIPALDAAIAALRSNARNHTHVAKTLMRTHATRELPTAIPEQPA